MLNKLYKSLFAVAMVLGAAMGFVSCTETNEPEAADPTVALSVSTLNFTMEEGSQSVDVTSNADWKVDNANDWVTVTPENGNGNKTLTVTVSMNNTGAVRTANIKVIALHKDYGAWETKTLKVSQSADSQATVDEVLLYSDDFDGKTATKTYGSSNGSWPYIDQFPEFANPKGDAAANVTYSGAGVSVRANSTSNSDYSDYAGSGSNNIFFGGGAYFQVNDIAPLEGLNYKITFGTEKYTQDGDSTFRNEEFIVSLSKDGEKWAPIEYTYAGVEPGRWNVATANFTLAAATEKLYIKFEAKVASVYRLDDLKFYVGNGGQTIDLDNIQTVEPEPPTTDALYFENFDGKAAVKDGNYWPYVTDFPEMKNAVGPAASNVSYDGHNTTVRNNSNSDGSYSDYAGSGVNNIFFGKGNAWFMVKELALESSQKNLILTFGTEKYSQSLGSIFTPSEFLVQLSADGTTWSNVEYTFAGTAEGRWNVATANFTLKTVPAKLYIKFTALAESAYRLDDVTLDLGQGGQEIDLANGTAEQPGGGDEPENPDQPNVPANGAYESDSAFVCSSDNSTNAVYSLKNTTIAGNAVTGFKLGKSKQQGKFTSGAVSVTGTKYLNFYAGAWNGTTATLYVRVDGGVAQSVNLAGNVGAHDNAPYTNPELSFADSDHFSLQFEGLTESSKVEFSTNADFALTTHSGKAPDIAPRVIVCGVKLTDEPLGAETPGGGEPVNPEPEPEPEPTPGEVVVATVAEFLAAAEGETIYELTGVIKNVANTNYGNFDLKDATGTVYVYGINDKDGNKVFTSLGLKEGDTLTIRGKRTSYNDAPQMGSGVYVSHISAPEQEQPENEATLSFTDANNRVSWDANTQVWSANGITLTNNKGASTSNVADYVAPARFYKSSELIVECDHAISKIDFACNGGSYATALKDSITSGNVTVDGSIVTVTFSSPVSSYTIASLTGGQVRMNSLTVTYAE